MWYCLPPPIMPVFPPLQIADKVTQIRFLSLDGSEVETVKDHLYKTLGESARADPLVVPSANP